MATYLYIIAILAVILLILFFAVPKQRMKGLGFFSLLRDPKGLHNNLSRLSAGEKIVFLNMPTKIYLVTHPETAKELLKNNSAFEKNPLGNSDPLRSFTKADNVLEASGETWKAQRLVLNPAFRFESLQSFVPIFLRKSDEALDLLSTGKEVEACSVMHSFTLDALGLTMFSFDFGRLQGKVHKEYSAYEEVMSLQSNLLKGMSYMLPWSPYHAKIKESARTLYELFSSLVEERKRGVVKQDILQSMVANMDPNELMSNMVIFFIAGHETTASALGWILHVLAHRQDIQIKLREEIDEQLKGEPPTTENLKKLTYLSMVLKENLRVNSPIANIPTRIALEDTTLGGYKLKKGSVVGLGIQAIHLQEEFWPNPYKFDPERFSKDKIRGQDAFSFIPFSALQRKCIGNNFSMIEQQVFVTRLLQRCSVHPTIPSDDGWQDKDRSFNPVFKKPPHTKLVFRRLSK